MMYFRSLNVKIEQMKGKIVLIVLIFCSFVLYGQKKVLFDATKAEMAGNADWVIDADHWDLGFSSGHYVLGGGNESDPQRFPTPSQSEVTSSTLESFWTGALSAWAIELVKQGYEVETLPYNGRITYGDTTNDQDLSHYQMFVVCEPNFRFTDSEKVAILRYVYNGGSLFMISDHNQSDRDGDGWDSPHIWNDLMDNNPIKDNPFGITFDYKNFSDNTKVIINDASNPVIFGKYGRVEDVEFHGGTSMTLDPSKNSTVEGLVYYSGVGYPSGNTDVLVAMARYGKGKVVAIGDSSPFDDGTGDRNDRLYDGWLEDASGNHKILIMNASLWLLNSSVSRVKPSAGQNISLANVRNGVVLSGLSFGGRVEVYDLTGREVYQANSKGERMIITGLKPGIYILRYRNKEVVDRKFVILP